MVNVFKVATNRMKRTVPIVETIVFHDIFVSDILFITFQINSFVRSDFSFDLIISQSMHFDKKLL